MQQPRTMKVIKGVHSAIVLLCVLVMSPSLYAAEAEGKVALNMKGVWCGAWDERFAVCFDIEQVEGQFNALYRWEETLDRGFQKQQLNGRLLNANTLDFTRKIVIFDVNNPDVATAIGIFDGQSRIARLTRQSNSGNRTR